MKKYFTKLGSLLVLAFSILPTLVFAQSAPNDVQGLAKMFYNTSVKLLIPMAFTAGLLFFMWRGAVYIFSSGSEEAKTEGRRVLTFGVIALFAMASIWGIIRFFQEDVIGITSPQHPPLLERNPN